MKRLYYTLFGALFVIVILSILLVFLYAPVERTMGIVQKIFYFHVPSAWVSFIAFFIVFVSGILYLMKKDRYWDIVGYASAEVGIVFCSLVLITGPIWAYKAWGVAWTWDARLTSFMVLWLIYCGYLMLRNTIENEGKSANLSAVVGIVGFINVPLVYMSTRWWRTQHPQAVIGGGKSSGLDFRMFITLMVCLAAFTLLFLFILKIRIGLEKAREELKYMYRQIDTE